jgi:hypothetical protein
MMMFGLVILCLVVSVERQACVSSVEWFSDLQQERKKVLRKDMYPICIRAGIRSTPWAEQCLPPALTTILINRIV